MGLRTGCGWAEGQMAEGAVRDVLAGLSLCRTMLFTLLNHNHRGLRAMAMSLVSTTHTTYHIE